jgi:hypothetical protein
MININACYNISFSSKSYDLSSPTISFLLQFHLKPKNSKNGLCKKTYFEIKSLKINVEKFD